MVSNAPAWSKWGCEGTMASSSRSWSSMKSINRCPRNLLRGRLLLPLSMSQARLPSNTTRIASPWPTLKSRTVRWDLSSSALRPALGRAFLDSSSRTLKNTLSPQYVSGTQPSDVVDVSIMESFRKSPSRPLEVFYVIMTICAHMSKIECAFADQQHYSRIVSYSQA